MLGYISDQILRFFQRRCTHPEKMVELDITEGCKDGTEVRYCRRCGAAEVIRETYNDLYVWRYPDPNL